MDGVSSASIAENALSPKSLVTLIPLQYSKEDELFQLALTKQDICYFVDFSLKRDKMIKLSEFVKQVIVIDHHKTAQAELVDLPDNVEVNFDMNESGATLTWQYFNTATTPLILEYIKDRDLWLWNLPNSKEFNEALAFLVTPNDTLSFKQVLLKSEFSELVELGKILIEKQSRQVQSKLTKVTDLSINNIDFKVINVTENISELGNAICIEYNKPALMYFITQDMKVICSLRSTNDLPDVSTVASTFGGGGHRNACGFTTDLPTFLQDILKI
jgi:oligoribonuclease NrnB/cAMP/cGMP phosphodiesterase (DHH superfamily)